MKNRKIEIAHKGERTAAKHLKRCGYKILERNFRCRLGEIDIVAQDNQTIVFVEVRTKSSIAFGTPLESIIYPKQKRLLRLGEIWLAIHGLEKYDCRFDIISIIIEKTGSIKELTHLKQAFPF